MSALDIKKVVIVLVGILFASASVLAANPRTFRVFQGGTGQDNFPDNAVLATGTSTNGRFVATTTPTFNAFHATSTSATSTIDYGLSIANGGIRIGLPDCDTLDTDALGAVICGLDANTELPPDLIYRNLSNTKYYTASSSVTNNLAFHFNNGFVSSASSTVAGTARISEGLFADTINASSTIHVGGDAWFHGASSTFWGNLTVGGVLNASSTAHFGAHTVIRGIAEIESDDDTPMLLSSPSLKNITFGGTGVGADYTFTSLTAEDPTVEIRGHESQTGRIFTVANSLGTDIFYIEPSTYNMAAIGDIEIKNTTPSLLFSDTSGGAEIDDWKIHAENDDLIFQNIDNVPTGNEGETRWQDSSGNTIMVVDLFGRLNVIYNGYTSQTSLDPLIDIFGNIILDNAAVGLVGVNADATMHLDATLFLTGMTFFNDAMLRYIDSATGNLSVNASYNAAPVWEISGADNGAQTVGAVANFRSAAIANNSGSGTTALTISTWDHFTNTGGTIQANTTISTLRGFVMSNTAPSGTLTNQYGAYISNLTGGTNDYGVYIAGADTYALWVDSDNTRFDGLNGFATSTPVSEITVGAADNALDSYMQIDSEAGAPPAADCDSFNESGRMMIDHTNDRLYVCNQHSARGWDYIGLTD